MGKVGCDIWEKRVGGRKKYLVEPVECFMLRLRLLALLSAHLLERLGGGARARVGGG